MATLEELKAKAVAMLDMAYVPYSHFPVGAALECEDGAVFTGCNIENSSYGLTNCAERTAFFTAIAAGETEFESIAVVGGKNGDASDIFPPCGVCRQVMAEFCDPDSFFIVVAESESDYEIRTLRKLLPEGFGSGNLADCIQ